jgi:hypothetical protein
VNPEVLAEWFGRQGHRVARTATSWWYEVGSRVYQAFPFHWSIRPSEDEVVGLLRSHRALALRYSTPLDAPEGRVSYHAICTDREYGPGRLDSRARNAVKNGLSRARVERVPIERVADEGWPIEADTCRRQGRALPMTREAWRRRHLAAAALPGFEAWGAHVEGRLVACMLCVRVDDWVEVLSQQSLAEFLSARVNNALTFVFTEDAIRRPGVRAVFYTVQSLDAPARVDEFKFRMGYLAAPLRQRVVVHPSVPKAILPSSHRLLRAALRLRPSSRWLAKAEGMLRFHEEGRVPADRQEWPEVLREGKHTVRAPQEWDGAAPDPLRAVPAFPPPTRGEASDGASHDRAHP